MRKSTPILSLAALVLLLLVLQVATGPYRTLAAIRSAIVEDDAGALAAQVDFPPLRASLKGQLQDRLARRYGAGEGDGLLGIFARGVASAAADGAVEVMVTPLGLGALMQGRRMWSGARDAFDPPPAAVAGAAPLADPQHRFESTSRFTATVSDHDGRPVVFVLTRSGLRWKLSDIRLPMEDSPGT